MLPRRTGPLRRANTTAGEPRTGARRSLQDRAIAAYGRAKAFRGGTYASRVAFGLCRRAGTGGQSCCLILAGTPSAKECTSADPRPLCAGISLGARQWRRRAPSRQRLNGQPAAPVEIPVPKREDVGDARDRLKRPEHGLPRLLLARCWHFRTFQAQRPMSKGRIRTPARTLRPRSCSLATTAGRRPSPARPS